MMTDVFSKFLGDCSQQERKKTADSYTGEKGERRNY